MKFWAILFFLMGLFCAGVPHHLFTEKYAEAGLQFAACVLSFYSAFFTRFDRHNLNTPNYGEEKE